MAFDVTLSKGFSGRPYDLRLRVWESYSNTGNNTSGFNWSLYVYSRSGYGSYRGDASTWGVEVNLDAAEHYPGSWSGSSSLDFRPDYAGKVINISQGATGIFPRNTDGNCLLTMRAAWAVGSPFGTADTGYQTGTPTRFPEAPGTPGTPTFSGITSIAANMVWTAAYRGHADITEYQWQFSTSSTFSSILKSGTVAADSRFVGLTKLTANTRYYGRTRAINSDGTGPWSSAGTFLTSNPPVPVPSAPRNLRVTNTVSPAPGEPTRTQFTIRWDPPASGAPITHYKWSYGNGFAGDTGEVSGSTLTATFSIATSWGSTAQIGVAAENSSGYGDSTDPIYPFVPDPGPGPDPDPDAPTGRIKWYSGGSWAKKPVKAYTGSVWAVKPVKRYTGSVWATV